MKKADLFNIFRDLNLREEMARNGFIRMPFLEEDAVSKLRNVYEEVRKKVPLKGFATTTTSEDFELKKQMFAELQPLYRSKVESVFQDYKLLGSSFLQKDAGEAGFLPLHQDWTVTDEAQFRTFTIWIPLVATTAENGAMQVIPGSHQWMNLLRGPNLPPAITDLDANLREQLELQPMEAGEALIFDHSLLHASTLNQSDLPRVAVTYGICHKATPLCFWYHQEGDAKDRFEKIAVPDDFFLRYPKIGSRPAMGRSLGFYQHDLSKLAVEDLANMQASGIHRKISRFYGPKEENVILPPNKITQRASWNRELEEKGYVLIPLMDDGTVAYLKEFFLENHPEDITRFYASVHHPDKAFRLRMDAEIRRTLRILLGRILEEGELLGSSFIAKPKGSQGILPPHSDWNIVDERHSRSYNLWIPLVDTTVENGAVHVIPGSHNWMDDFRGPGIPNPYADLKEEIWAAMQPLEMAAGTALLYDHRLLHASPNNQTDELRIACVSGIKSKSADLRYYHGDDRIIRAYAADSEFYLTGNPDEGPGQLEFLEEVSDLLPEVTKADLLRFLGKDEEGANPTKPSQGNEASSAQSQRSFFETYTPKNIWKELKWRLGGKKSS